MASAKKTEAERLAKIEAAWARLPKWAQRERTVLLQRLNTLTEELRGIGAATGPVRVVLTAAGHRGNGDLTLPEHALVRWSSPGMQRHVSSGLVRQVRGRDASGYAAPDGALLIQSLGGRLVVRPESTNTIHVWEEER